MIEQWFNALSAGLYGGYSLALAAAFGWGILSIILSPCHLSSIPLVIGYISARSERKLKKSFLLALVFSIGILITIAAIGLITASMGRLLGDVGSIGNYLVAAVFFTVGLYLMDIIRLPWDGFQPGQNQRGGLPGALVLGLIFGVGLGPCTFAFMAPVLGVVFQTSQTDLLKGILLIAAFGIGHCAVITLAGSLTHLVQRYLNWTLDSSVAVWIKRVAGFLVILGGVYFIRLTF
ncbi:MAG: cytochrome C biogenesis protein [FCB group bacterium]|nr:cytochrome C biogenesis protein [FCB group bacterium]